MLEQNSIVVIFGMSKQGKTYLLNQKAAKHDRVIFIDPMNQFSEGLIFTSAQNVLNYFEERDPETFRIICRFEEQDERYIETETVFKLAKKIKNTLLVIDEVDKLTKEGQINKTLWQLINFFRHFEISIFCCARRPARVSRDLTGNADEIICFKTQEPTDLKYLKEFGFNEDILRTLPKYESISNLG